MKRAMRLPRGVVFGKCQAAALLAAYWMLGGAAQAMLPSYDHLVVVIEENEGYGQIIGSTAAPYINSLANGGVSFTNMRSVTHPSQPNYHEFFSGDNQGVTGDSPAVGTPFSTPNLGAALIASGRTFKAYSESLPAAGDITTEAAGYYYRRHCPWTNWMKTGALAANQLSPSLHQTFGTFPSNFNTLPTLAFVIPNNANNMHDFGVASGDAWLSQRVSAYAEWAKTHNSLLIVIWDEDNFQTANRIPAIFYGANLRDGTLNAGSWTIHNVLHTLEDLFGLAHSGRSAEVQPLTGVFTGELPVNTRVFQNGLAGYAGTHDTSISEASPAASNETATSLAPAGGTGARVQALVGFDDLFGASPSQLPASVNIESAKLFLGTTTGSAGKMRMHRMLRPWSDSSTWDSLAAGVSTDDSEAAILSDATAVPNAELGFTSVTSFDATVAVRSWESGAENDGWTIQTTSAPRWIFASAEAASNPPALEITFSCGAVNFGFGTVTVSERAGFVDIPILRSGDLSDPVSVSFATGNGTAGAGTDYTAMSGTFDWAAGDSTPRTIRIPILSDSIVEVDEYFRILISNPTGLAVIDRAATLLVTIRETPFDQWRKAKFGAILTVPQAASDADPDGDGISNLLEFAYNSDPLSPRADAAPVLDGTDFATLTFSRNAGATDLTFIVQASSDLQNWADGSTYSDTASMPSNAVTTEVSHTTGTTETIVVRDNVAASPDSPRFLRLRVERN